MSQSELLRNVVAILDGLGIDYMLTGSMASSLQGAPRLTHDIDLVIALSEDVGERLFAAFDPASFYLSRTAIDEAIAQRGMFNLLEYASGDQVDFWLLTDEPFDQSRFARKRAEQVFGTSIQVSSPEDTILAKLRWALMAGGSPKQLSDVRSILELQGEILDDAYLEDWARELGVTGLWRQIRSGDEPK